MLNTAVLIEPRLRGAPNVDAIQMKRGVAFWLREPLLLGLGALPATLLSVLPLFALGLRDPWAKPLAALALLGVIGLWRAPFQDPAGVSSKTAMTSVLLVCGLIAILPFTGALILGVIKVLWTSPMTFWTLDRPVAPRQRGNLTEGLVFLWCFFGPPFCALYFLSHQTIARLRHRRQRRERQRLGDVRH